MAKIIRFEINNFKGAEGVQIDIESRSSSPVLTFIGLNESGKSTLLEAISHFVSGDKSIASLFEGSYAQASALSLIPLHRKAAFTGSITVAGVIQLDADDIQLVQEALREFGVAADTKLLADPFKVVRTFKFQDSALHESTNYWFFKLHLKKGKSATYKLYARPSKDSGETDLWFKTMSVISGRLPRVAYFPTFLVDMPARIYLKEHEKESAINRHYRFVLQDILDSLGEGLNLEKHVCKRIEEFKEKEATPYWLSVFFGSANKTPIDSVFQKLSNAITKEVLGSWQKIFQRAISAKNIMVDWNVDAQKENLPYASFFVSDGESRYAINERSLGFRWFFSFLLFTGFKQMKTVKTIFVFDEPAANLHAKAQAELLTSFSRIASNGNKIIYSTHSHHMINPRWLNSAYIVENAALDYDKQDNFGLDTKPTHITATPYRQFVAKFPTRSSYFQPVIEKLEYVSPSVIGSGPYLIVEGISDYYALKLAQLVSKKTYGFSVVPGTGSGASGPIISQMLGQSMNFAVLLDDDKEGRKARANYLDTWFLASSSVLTLGAVNSSFEGKGIEKLLGLETINLIKEKLELPAVPNKKQIGWYLAEACANPQNDSLPQSAVEQIQLVFEYFESHFGNFAREASGIAKSS